MAPDFAGVRLLHLGRVHVPGQTAFKPHAHACHELIVPLRGRLRADLGGRHGEIGPGEVLWYPTGAEHLERVAGKGAADWHFLLIDWSGGDDWPLAIPDRNGTVRLVTGLLAGAQAEAGTAAEAKRQALAAALVAELSSLCARGLDQRPDDLVTLADQWIRRHLSQTITVGRLAQAVGLSRAHFTRSYHAQAGHPPMAAVRDLRLAAARDLLLTTDLPLREIAPRVGIGSEYLLSRWLSRHYGVGAQTLRRGRRSIATS